MLGAILFGLFVWWTVRMFKRFGFGGDKPPHPGPGWGGRGPAPTGPLPKKWPGGGPDIIPDWVVEEVGSVTIPKPSEPVSDREDDSQVPSTTQPLRMA